MNSTISGNSADPAGGVGGAIVNVGTLTITNSTFSGNGGYLGVVGGTSGGGISNGGTLTVTNSTFSGNSANAGGAIFNVGGTGLFGGGSVVATNSTFSGNSAVGEGAYGAGIYNGGGLLTMTNTIVASSSGANCGAGIIDGGHNLQFPGIDCGATIPTLDPMLDPEGLKDNGGPTQTIALLPGSRAINAGDPEVCANPPVNGLDQRGYARPGSGSANCSIGAYEYDSPGPPVSCVGDCGNDERVTVDEIITLVNIALGNMGMSECEAGDDNDDGQITVDEILKAVNQALNGCG